MNVSKEKKKIEELSRLRVLKRQEKKVVTTPKLDLKPEGDIL